MMSNWVQSIDWHAIRREPLAHWEIFYKEHQQTLHTVGIIALAGTTGAVIGGVLGKGLFAVKGAAALKAGAATALHPATTTAATTAATTVTTPGTLQSTVSLLNNTALTGVTLVDKVAALFKAITTNAVPLTAGAVGGGAVGVGAVRGQVRQVREKLEQQIAQTVAAQAEAAHIQAILSGKEAHLAELLQAQLTTPPSDNLEAIRGIGQVMAQRLNAAGIHTFAALAAQTPQQLRAIIGTGRSAAMMNPEAWIAEAQQRVASAGATPPPHAPTGEQSTGDV